jgi:hypothetical protein
VIIISTNEIYESPGERLPGDFFIKEYPPDNFDMGKAK